MQKDLSTDNDAFSQRDRNYTPETMTTLQQIASLLGEGLSSPAYITSIQDVQDAACAPPCECNDCQHGFYAVEEQIRPCFWYNGELSDHEATTLASKYVYQAEGDRQYLLKCLSSHGDIIMSRWKKKSKDKRQALLSEEVPDLCEERWIIPRYCYMSESQTGGLKVRSRRRRYQLLQHWLSMEVLKSNPAVLFALLRNRTAYTLQEWATFDGRQLILSWACGHFDNEFNKKCVIMHGSKYGELVEWEPGPAHRADILGFPKARLILEGQTYLLGVLRDIVDRLLDGVDMNKPGSSEKWQQMTRLGFRHSNELELWSPYTNQAFSSPPVFSIDNLISIAQTRLDAAGDHLWFLQTDPAYMRRHIKTICQGEFYRTIKKEAAGAVLTTAIFQDVISYWRWTWVKNECEHVKSARDRFRSNIYPGEALPVPYDRSLGALELLVVNEVLNRAEYFGTMLPQRPGFSYKWTFKWKPEASATSFQLGRRQNEAVDQAQLLKDDPLEWCLSQMQAEPDKQTNYDHAIMFAFLENYLATSSSRERKRVDELLHRNLSDLAACHEMLVSIRLHRPQNVARDIEEVKRTETRIAWKGKSIPGYLTDEDIIQLGTALLRDFQNAPLPGGKKDAVWAQRTQSIRSALEAFWQGVGKSPKFVFEQCNFTEEEIQDTLRIISAHLTPEYVEIVEAERQEMLAADEAAKWSTSTVSQGQWDSKIDSAIRPVSPKAKIKSRPAEQARQVTSDDIPIAELHMGPVPKHAVKKRALDMISLMFPRTGAESAKGIDWDPFVLAMSDLGFLAKNVGGSAITFERRASGKDGGGKIIFHKPHPNSKIDPIMLHSMGKRMTKWFGWERDLFVLEGS
ncbi:hypothetical protein ACEPPN_003805 [Leptodophora sp. 'Broadleaf-Isolate-01']